MARKVFCALETLSKACLDTTTVVLEPYKCCYNAKPLCKRYFIWIWFILWKPSQNDHIIMIQNMDFADIWLTYEHNKPEETLKRQKKKQF